MSEAEASRRNVLFGVAAAGVAVPVLAACGSDDSGDTTAVDPTDSAEPTTDPGAGQTDSPAGGGIPTSDIPVGGGEILKDQNVVVTQPKAGEFKAFSATCTHQGCQVAKVTDGQILCTCHGSSYDIATGDVTGGPAPRALAEKTVTVTGDTLTVS